MQLRDMGNALCTAALGGALMVSAAAPALAAPACWSGTLVNAAKLRQLDVMLMVGSLRCRGTAQDYRAAYDRFLLRHRPALGKANMMILGEMRAQVGSVAALRTLDEASVRMANRYGEQTGYGCADLGEVTSALADSGDDALPNAADMLVGEDVALAACPVQIAAAVLTPPHK